MNVCYFMSVGALTQAHLLVPHIVSCTASYLVAVAVDELLDVAVREAPAIVSEERDDGRTVESLFSDMS
jgi:hypothetical protein